MDRFSRDFVMVGLVFFLFGIVGGAFGAHALEKYLDANTLASYHTACDYWIYQGLGAILLGLISKSFALKLKAQLRLLVTGTLLFSGSITILCLDQLMGLELRWLGPITPVGGSLIILAWVGVLLKVGKKAV